jgi:hypothetical protein
MADKTIVRIIITAGVHTNRTYIARKFGMILGEINFDVDLSNVPASDNEPHLPGEKEEDVAAGVGTRFLLSEHRLGTPFVLDQGRPAPKPLVRPAVQHLFEPRHTGFAVIGGPNCGKSTLIDLFADFLKSEGMADELITKQLIGEDFEWTKEQLLENMRSIKQRIQVVFYTRRAYGSEHLEPLLSTTDGYNVEKEAESEQNSLPQ